MIRIFPIDNSLGCTKIDIFKNVEESVLSIAYFDDKYGTFPLNHLFFCVVHLIIKIIKFLCSELIQGKCSIYVLRGWKIVSLAAIHRQEVPASP